MKHEDIRRTYKNITKLMNKEINLGVIPTAKYSQKDHLRVLLSAAVENTSAEAITDEVEGFPSADTVLGNLGNQEWETIKKGFDEVIKLTIQQARKHRWFARPVTLAIDIHDDLYYGNPDNGWVVSRKFQRGTSYAFRIATIEVVEYGKRFCLGVVPMKKGDRKGDRKVYIIGELIEQARGYVKVKCVLLDRDFYDVVVVKHLKASGIDYIIGAPIRNNRFRRLISKAGEEDIDVDHKMTDITHRERESVRFVSHHNSKERHNYITNMCLSPKAIYGVYSKRWGIETGYRVKGNFEANTTSSSHVIRHIYMMISVCLYNVWVLMNLLVDFVIIKMIECSEIDGKRYSPSITTRKLKKMCFMLLCSY